jgi:maltooligosyltrehalose trehalohydrolase
LSQFPSYATPEAQMEIPDPGSESTFLKSKLNLAERQTHGETYLLHQDLLRLRREDPVIGAQARERLDGAVLSPTALVIRFFGREGDRLLFFNLGADLEYGPSPEPLLALPAGRSWTLTWSSEDPRYGGAGRMHPYQEGRWRLAGGSAILLSVGSAERPNR